MDNKENITFGICGETLKVRDFPYLYTFVLADQCMAESHIADEMALLKTKDVFAVATEFEMSFDNYVKMNDKPMACGWAIQQRQNPIL